MGNKTVETGKQSLQDFFLNTLRKERVPVSIFLVNGIQLVGQIESFDQYSVLLKSAVSQVVYKHAISTIVPSRPISLQFDHPSGEVAVMKRTKFGLRRTGNTERVS